MRSTFVSRSLALSVASCLAAAAPSAGASDNLSIFAMLCATSIGFSDLERDACFRAASEPGSELRKTPMDADMLLALLMSGGNRASMVVRSTTGLAAIPYVKLNVDPCDTFLSNGGDGCSATPGARGLAGFALGSLDGVLTDEQEALLGCGPFFGTDCEVDGIDLANAEASVLLQSFPSYDGSRWIVPGARGPGDPSYDPDVDGCVAPSVDPACADADELATPSGPTFESEMAALSWNFLMTVVALDADFDPAQPTSQEPNRCSFAQPQYCDSVLALLPEPEPSLGALAAFGAVAILRRGRAR